MLLALFCLLPLLDAMNALIKFAQGKDVFIYDFVAVVKIYQTDFYMMYSYPSNNYQCEHFQMFLVGVKIVLPQSRRIGLLTSTMVWKHLLFIWLVTVMQLTFSIRWLVGLNSLYARPFLKHPSCRWKASALLQLTCSSLSWIRTLWILSWWMQLELCIHNLDVAWCCFFFLFAYGYHKETLLWSCRTFGC